MIKLTKKRITGLVLCFLLLVIPLTHSTATPDDPAQAEIDRQLQTLTEEERLVLEELFGILQNIEDLERQQAQLESDLLDAEARVEIIGQEIENQQALYNTQRDVMGEVLKSYQRRGPGSTIEIMLASSDFSDLIKRINLVRDMTRNTGELLDVLAEQQERLLAEQAALEYLLATIEQQRAALVELLEANLALKDDLEDRLAALEDERADYEERLSGLDQVWREATGAFSTFVAEFGRLMDSGGLPQEAITITFRFPDVVGSLGEEAFNQALRDSANIQGVDLRFRPDRIVVRIPDREFELSGTFDILEGHTLQFVAEEGTFYGIRLTDTAIQELFSDGLLELNLEPVLEGNTLRSVRIQEGLLELISRPSFF